jgi:deoxyhypusine synthase
MQSDYSIVMPFLVKALLDNRQRYARMVEAEGQDAVFAKQPKARGYLRAASGYRLFDNRGELVKRLAADVAKNRQWLLDSMAYPLAATQE